MQSLPATLASARSMVLLTAMLVRKMRPWQWEHHSAAARPARRNHQRS